MSSFAVRRPRGHGPAVAAFLALLPLAACAEAPGGAAEATGDPPDAPPLSSATSALMVGQPAQPSARPWAAFVHAGLPGGEVMRCSGVLIAPNLVLTSAQCTVCATSAAVGLLGESALPGAPPLTFRSSAAGGITTAPGSFTSAPDCSGTETSVALSINDRVVNGRALGLIRLSSSSPAAVAKVLLQPPLGFSPVQDLAGPEQVTVVSGGAETYLGGGHLMREAKFALQRYTNAGAGTPDCDPTMLAPFTMQRQMEANVGALKGDAGGAWVAKPLGFDQVIGIAQNETAGLFDDAAPTFILGNASFIRAGLGESLVTTDGDGDEVADVVDNCPLDANRDQLDRDLDGVGDVCDNCTPLRGNNSYLPTLDSYDASEDTFPEYHNPDQANCNQDAEDAAILAGGGSLAPLSDAQYMGSFGASYYSTCQASPLTKVNKQRRGDKCDAVPCARTEPRTTTLPAANFGPLAWLCGANGYAIGTCSYSATSGFSLAASGSMAATPGQDGLRFCRCDLPHATPAQRRLFCASGPAGCAVDPALYQLDHPKWKKLDLVGADPSGEKLTALSFPAGTATVDWNWQDDLTALTGVAIPAPPWTLDGDGAIAGGPKLRGVLWSHVVTYAGQPTSAAGELDGRSVVGLASAYGSGDHRITRKTHWKKIPRYKPHYWWEYCAGCEVMIDQPWIEVVRTAAGGLGAAVAFGAEGGTDVTAFVDAAALPLLDAGTHVNAAEPEATLARSGVARRALVLRSGSLDVIGALGSRDGRLIAESLAGVAPALGSGEAVATAYSAVRGELWAFRRPAGGAASLQRYSTATQKWSAMRRTGAALSTPLAAAYAPAERMIYLLDRGAGALVRLLRIDADTGVTTVVHDGLFDGSFSAMALAVDAAGVLLAVGADGRLGQTDAAHLQLGAEGAAPILLDRATMPAAQAAGTVAQTAAGVSFLVRRSDGYYEPRLLRAADFQRIGQPVSGPVF